MMKINMYWNNLVSREHSLLQLLATNMHRLHGPKHELQKLNSFSTSPLVLSSCKRCISCLTQLWQNGLGQ